MQFLDSCSPLLGRYDAFILDLWGVIHDGIALYPEVKESLETIRKAGKDIVFLSNAPRRAEKVIAQLSRLGIAPGLYDDAMSSGEAGHQHLKTHRPGDRYVFLGKDDDRAVMDGLDYKETDAAQADFILNAGFENDSQPLSDFTAILSEGKARNLPMICLNPDYEVVRLTGSRALCAGAIAEAYEDMGGRVTYFGKPYPDVYHHCLKRLSAHPKERILAVGDNLHTDILGGINMHLDTALVTGGVLTVDLKLGQGGNDEAKIRQRIDEENTCPDWIVPALKF